MSPILINLACGLVSAVLFMSGTTGSSLGTILMSLAPLPLFIAGLGFGVRHGVIAAGAGLFTVAIAIGGFGPLFYFAFVAIPAPLITYAALLRRAIPAPGDPRGHAIEWFPAGNLILIAAGFAAIGVAVALAAAFGADDYQEKMRSLVEPVFETLSRALTQDMTPEQISALRESFVAQAVRMLPAIFSVSAMLVILGNLWIAGFALRRSGQLDRPWLPLQTLDYPKPAAAILLIAFLASRMGGTVGLAAMALTGTLVMAYFILGAVALLALSSGTVMRPLAVMAVILAMIIEPFAMFLALFGLAENFLQLRARRSGAGHGPPQAT